MKELEQNRERSWRKRTILLLGATATFIVMASMSGNWWSAHDDSRVNPPPPLERTEQTGETRPEYPLHRNITATIFWVGEPANESNANIHNRESAWTSDWVAAYGGIDAVTPRCGHWPCGFTPRENPFYFALPFGDYTTNGLKPAEALSVIPWYTEQPKEGESILKNRWIEVTLNGRKAYAQWEDVGPYEDDDAAYVFGEAPPKNAQAGLDMSPAFAKYLGATGIDKVDWRFVDESDVPAGVWRDTVTRSGPDFR